MIRTASVVKLVTAFRAETTLSCALHVLLHITYCYGYVYRDELTAQMLIRFDFFRCKITSCIIQLSDWIIRVHSHE